MLNLLYVLACDRDDQIDSLAVTLASSVARLPGVEASHAGRTLPRALNGASLMWRLSFTDEAAYEAVQTSALWREYVTSLLTDASVTIRDRIIYHPRTTDVSKGRQREGVWRCLVLSVDAGTTGPVIRQFEQDLLLMPDCVSTIKNWSFGPVVSGEGRRRWTHVWEQEFDDISGLEGEYMMHPIHWGLVDGWFDAECPHRIVDTLLIHAAFAIEEAVIQRHSR